MSPARSGGQRQGPAKRSANNKAPANRAPANKPSGNRASGSKPSGNRASGNRSPAGRRSVGRGGADMDRSPVQSESTGLGDRSRSGERATLRPPRPPKYGLGGSQVEGRHAVREVLLAGRRKVQEIHLVSDMDRADILDDIVELARVGRVLVREVSKRVLDLESATESAQGVIARVAELEPVELDDLCVAPKSGAPAPFLVALDGVTDPRNLGAVLRTAECAGVSGIVLPRHRAVHITPTVTKTAAGAIEYLPMALVGGLPAAIERMKRHGIWVVGLDMDGETSIFDVKVADSPICLVLGAEGRGLSKLVRSRCDAIASIPLNGNLSSLNVGTAAAIATFEVSRRRAASPRVPNQS